MAPNDSARPSPSAFSIRIASRLTGVPADTLRMWERRYGFPKPDRTSTGTRLYQEADIARLQLLRRALEAGYRPSDVVPKTEGELEQLVRRVAPPERTPVVERDALDSMYGAVVSMDGAALRMKLRQMLSILGPKQYLMEVVQPTVHRIGDAWQSGELEICHEHFFTEALTTQLRQLIAMYEDGEKRPVVLLATLPGEPHALGLQMTALYLAIHGGSPRLLGPMTPVGEIAKAARRLDVDAVGISVSPHSDPTATADQIARLLPELPRKVEVWLGGAGAREVHCRSDGVHRVMSWAEFDEAMARASAGP